ncbi:hypothetical protein HanRHA438_Chr05g0236771 [Helianthus annuus]|uniref:Uncharacterized protein n=1 Tax=Helianthus annuus TaxID=4232 RepID=A0A9K3J223_HELAN|nr:uncharacterized protein LOC110941771 [Helianthus annuus]KAF5806958.1 hypothetical protein HanXRQr2_Chr05g0227621 [Helianthus annuus]KAJ0585501.1 hypothetical protein HanHA89_Chr05g0201041 [Helianthus annuus]KAJ0920066.1 hypothetical protein HanRHA438_Chr05g0236771 [Helianthus annuus]KAJ0923746.1 hypothetical protein HanPSC8_Chr05g0219661 [Helianthus annuus]
MVYVEVEAEEEVDLMEYNNVKGRRKRRGRKETTKRDEYEEEQERIDKPGISSKAEVDEKREDGLNTEEPSCVENENNGGGDDGPTGKSKVSKHAPAVKLTSKKEAKSRAKNLPKERIRRQLQEILGMNAILVEQTLIQGPSYINI